MKNSNYIELKDGTMMPRLGAGTWCLGDNPERRDEEIQALRTGLDAGLQLIDTAEMYGEGKSEQLVGQAIMGYPREDLFLVSKVYPHNAGKGKIYQSIDHSLSRLGTDYLDLYLLHWRGSVPLEETAECMEDLIRLGKIRRWGVSNFDTADMEELMKVNCGTNCTVNQVLYHLGSRGIEYDLLPWLREHKIPVMAYCPLAQAGTLRQEMMNNPVLQEIANKYRITIMQLLLTFVLQQKDVVAIPRTGNKTHILKNWETQNILLSPQDLQKLNQEYPAPTQKQPLDIV